MLEQICAYIHNYFYGDRLVGSFTIEEGSITLPFIDGQYFRVCGSHLNDGVYQYPATGLTDETFNGVIWEMRPPRALLALAEEISAWVAKYGDAVTGPYQSESFGGYSYTLKSGTGANGQSDASAAGWQGVFKSRLDQWRKLA